MRKCSGSLQVHFLLSHCDCDNWVFYLQYCVRVRATNRHCRQMRKNNKFGAKNIKLATTIGERKITGENFSLASERLHRLKIIASCRLMVINVYLNCQLTPQLSDHTIQ